MKHAEKLKGFGVGLAMTGMAAITAAAPRAAGNLCAGACSQCYACGLTALPLALWLVEKRWSLVARMRNLLRNLAGKDCGLEDGRASKRDRRVVPVADEAGTFSL
jgi:hypothetical protein